MKIVFSEVKSDYQNYIFPYAVWAFPEQHESASTIFAHGFLPASREMDRYYLCRQVRVRLNEFSLSSENRRILRKGEGISAELISASDYRYTPDRRESFKTYADIKFGKDVMTYDRLDSLFNSSIITDLLVFKDIETNKEIGTVTLFLQPGKLAYYYYAFYDLNYYARNLGMFMMTRAVQFFAGQNFDFIYLGTCYKRNAVYKTQFRSCEFFNGFKWSDNIKELKYLIKRDKSSLDKHLLETPEFCEKFYGGDVAHFALESPFSVRA